MVRPVWGCGRGQAVCGGVQDTQGGISGCSQLAFANNCAGLCCHENKVCQHRPPRPCPSTSVWIHSPSELLWSSSASAALLMVCTRRPVVRSSRKTLLSLLPRMMEPSAVRLGADSTSSGREIGRRCDSKVVQHGRQAAGSGVHHVCVCAGQAGPSTAGDRAAVTYMDHASAHACQDYQPTGWDRVGRGTRQLLLCWRL
jgi:hypothetical protein